MRTFEFSRNNVLIQTEDSSSLEIPDAMKCRANYQVFRVRGKTSARITRVERQDGRGNWLMDRLPTLERMAIEEHIERLYAEDDAEDARNVLEVAEGFA